MSNFASPTDTCVTDHMTYDKYKFVQLSPKCPINTITNANGVPFPNIGIGIVLLSLSSTLQDVLFVPALNCHPIYVKQLFEFWIYLA